MAKIIEIHGNIFESSCQTIVNTVNCVGIMGRGIAMEFKNRFPEMYSTYAQICENRQLQPGLLQIWKKSNPWILNFPTKNHWKHPSKLEYVEQGLIKFTETYMEKGVSSIAFPQLGTSLGGLNWEMVRERMFLHLEPLPNLDVEIYHFDPNAVDSLFDKLYQKIHRFETRDYKNFLHIKSKQASTIQSALQENELRSMMDFQKLKGVGEKTIEGLYDFARSERRMRLTTESEIQPSFALSP
ncbi:MAG: macro domain-containing protein [Candidatus Marinimicrobia bacterium]|jgi:O-acetyl-ADP-ribose deacetylase (regulator of RNase III)|nr:macro domain-containing protein [Candidatus Neomarinimicrobiota bacterium]MBT7973430.1 macro domain-containing protein [Candidatus Neomarinimicrobiota bacterium]